jgi:hypothetical protein
VAPVVLVLVQVLLVLVRAGRARAGPACGRPAAVVLPGLGARP